MSYNPWGKKNPFLSLWLGGANAMVGAARSQATAAMHRQAHAAIGEGTRHMLALWGIAPAPKRATKRATRTRRVSRRAR